MTTTQATHRGAALGFTTQTQETHQPRELALQGRLPDWLTGSLLRNGPGDWQAGTESLRHWFDGQALLHCFTFNAGRVRYTSRFLDTAARRNAEARGQLTTREFATDPCRSIFQRVRSLFSPAFTDNANISVHRLGDRLIAMTETPLPIVFDHDTLTHRGNAYQAPGAITSAHPHYERGSGALLNYAAHFGARSSYRLFRVAPDASVPEQLAEVPVRQPAYMHSFGITEHFFVLTEFPLVVNPLRLALANQPFIANYQWKPERGTRFTVIDRRSGTVRARLHGQPCFGFHHVNAYEQDDDTLIVDICVADDNRIIDDLYLDRILGRLNGTGVTYQTYPRLTRFTLDLDTRQVTSALLSDQTFDLPTVNNRRTRERPYTTTWGIGTDDAWIDRIHAVNVTTGVTRTWHEPDTYPGEPIFVERPGAEHETDGVLLIIALTPERGTSSLVALDATTLEPLARADVGHPIPFGFHGLHTS